MCIFPIPLLRSLWKKFVYRKSLPCRDFARIPASEISSLYLLDWFAYGNVTKISGKSWEDRLHFSHTVGLSHMSLEARYAYVRMLIDWCLEHHDYLDEFQWEFERPPQTVMNRPGLYNGVIFWFGDRETALEFSLRF